MLPRDVTGGAEVIGANGNARPFGQGNRDDGWSDRPPLRLPFLTLQAMAKPPPGADAYTNPPVKTSKHLQSALGDEMTLSCRVANLHDPRAYGQRYVNANRLMVLQTSRVSHRAMRVGRGLRGRFTDDQTVSSSVCSRPMPAGS